MGWLWRWSGHDCLRWCKGRATLALLVNAENLPVTGAFSPQKKLQTAGVPVGPLLRRELCCTSKFLYGPPIDLPLGKKRHDHVPCPSPSQGCPKGRKGGGGPGSSIGRMVGVDRPAIIADPARVIAFLLDPFLRAVVARLAEALQLTEPEVIPATAVVPDVVDDFGGAEDATLAAELAVRLEPELVALSLLPTGQAVPIAPGNFGVWSSAAGHGSLRTQGVERPLAWSVSPARPAFRMDVARAPVRGVRRLARLSSLQPTAPAARPARLAAASAGAGPTIPTAAACRRTRIRCSVATSRAGQRPQRTDHEVAALTGSLNVVRDIQSR